MTMHSPQDRPPQDIVVFPIRGRSSLQLLVALIMGAVFVGIAAAIVYAAITEGQWMFLIALPIMALALIGLFIDQFKNQRSSLAIRRDVPVLVVDDYGIGDGYLRVPWNMVRGVHTRTASSRRPGPRTLGRHLANKLSETAGVLDGDFLLTVETVEPLPAHVKQRGAFTVSAHDVVYDLGTAIPAAQWKPLAQAITQYADWRGVPISD